MRLDLRSPALLLVAGFWLALAGRAEQLPDQSPFLPPAGTPAASPATANGFELVGMTSFGRETLVSIFRQSDQRSLWIPLGRTMSDITAVSYDAVKDEAIIRVGNRTLTLPMRKGSVVAGLDAPLPPARTLPAAAASAPGAPPRPLTPTEEKEMEARMLVSDLLEIGQQQRKAYEEAQRQAAAKAATAKAQSAARPPPSTSAPPAARPDAAKAPAPKK